MYPHTDTGGDVVKKLVKHGNSLALVIDKPVLDILKISAETPLEISTDGDILIISPEREGKKGKQFKDALGEANRKYGKMLKRLT